VRTGDDEFLVIERLLERARQLELEAAHARLHRDIHAAERIYGELIESLAPQAQALTETATEAKAFAHCAYGVVLRILHLYPDAINQYTKGLALRPGTLDAMLDLTACFAAVGRLADAEATAHQAIETSPGSAAAWGNLATTLILQRKRDDARRAIDRALALDPEDPHNRQVAENFDRYFIST
jgi:tetratricopeptide (TPR) repeat protein